MAPWSPERGMNEDKERKRERERVCSNEAISGGKQGLANKTASLQTSSARQDNHQLISPAAEREEESGRE